MDQTVINILIGVAGFFGAAVLGGMWVMLRDLQKQTQDLHVTVAGKYVTTEALERVLTALFAKLDRMEGKIDLKVDKP